MPAFTTLHTYTANHAFSNSRQFQYTLEQVASGVLGCHNAKYPISPKKTNMIKNFAKASLSARRLFPPTGPFRTIKASNFVLETFGRPIKGMGGGRKHDNGCWFRREQRSCRGNWQAGRVVGLVSNNGAVSYRECALFFQQTFIVKDGIVRRQYHLYGCFFSRR